MVSWGGAIENVGWVYQLIDPKKGTKVTAMGAALEAFQTGDPAQQKDAIGEVVQAAGTHLICEKLGLDGWFGQMAAMMASKVIASYVEDLAAGMLNLDPEAEVGDKEFDAVIANAKTSAVEKATNMGVAAGIGGAGIAATAAGMEATGLNTNIVTAESIAKIQDTSLLTKADGKAQKEFLENHKAQMQDKIRSGEIDFMDSAAIATAGREAFVEQYGEDPSRLATREEYVDGLMPEKQHMSYRYYDSNTIKRYNEQRTEQEAFLGQEYDAKLAMETGNAERALQGKEPLSIEHYAAKPAEFVEHYDLKGVGNNMPLKGASLDVLQAEKGMTVNVDMEEYKKHWVTQKAEALQSVPGVGEYKSMHERTKEAEAAFDARYDNVQLVRKATAEEFYEANRTQEITKSYRRDGQGGMEVNYLNTDDVQLERESLMAKYNKLNECTSNDIDWALANPEQYEQQKMCEQEEQQNLFAQQREQIKEHVRQQAGGNIDLAAMTAGVGATNLVNVAQESTRVHTVNPHLEEKFGGCEKLGAIAQSLGQQIMGPVQEESNILLDCAMAKTNNMAIEGRY